AEGWARRSFDHWRAALKWQRLGPYQKFAAMIARHWDGIAAYCHPQNKVALGFVEGLNNKIRVLQRRAYGLRDEEYLRLKILTCYAAGVVTVLSYLQVLKSPTRLHEDPEIHLCERREGHLVRALDGDVGEGHADVGDL